MPEIEKHYGLAWKKIDLHIHTPASLEDLIDKSIKPEQIVDKAKELGLDAICISDHNTGLWVDKIKAAAQGTDITVFPGVEITVQGGRTNVHILAIFDPSKNTDDINHLLSTLGIIPEERGRIDVLAKETVNETINIISQSGGIPCLAHADSTSGVLHDMKGVPRRDVIQNPKLLGVHTVSDETAKFLDGNDPIYKRKLATFRASDSHDITGIGRQVTYFKMGVMTLSALRQCFLDPDTRIRKEIIESPCPRIKSIECSGGFLRGQRCDFHQGLNTIIGGKGVGKSLIIEFVRFALRQPSSITPIADDMQGKLISQLGLGETVTVYVRTQSGAEFKITRLFDGVDNPTEVENISVGSVYEGDTPRLFPILAYSQNEIVDVSRDTSAQLRLIDNLIDIASHNRAIEDSCERLRVNLDDYLRSIIAKQALSSILKEVETIDQEIKELDAVLGDPMFSLKKEWEHRKSTADAIRDATEGLRSKFQTFIDSIKKAPLTSLSDKDGEQIDLVSYHSGINHAITRLTKKLQVALDQFEAEITNVSKHGSSFGEALKQFEEQYEKFIKTVGGQKQALANRRTRRNRELQEYEVKLVEMQSKADSFKSLEKERNDLLDVLGKSINERYQARAAVYKQLTDMSAGRLKLTIQPNADKKSYIQAVMDLAYGTRIRHENLTALCKAKTPRKLVEDFVNRRTEEIMKHGDLTSEQASKFIEAVCSNEIKMRDLLSIPFDRIPTDIPQIEYLKEDQHYYPLNQLSVGQKCTALLLIALSEGSMPIVVDQPEDALDVATIYYDVVSRLRNRKESRQFILTTHNANIAVTSDSDKYHVLKATESRGEIVCCGAIDLDNVRSAVIDHLEGGTGPYTLRGKKYELAE